jgi:hypothetical protein
MPKACGQLLHKRPVLTPTNLRHKKKNRPKSDPINNIVCPAYRGGLFHIHNMRIEITAEGFAQLLQKADKQGIAYMFGRTKPDTENNGDRAVELKLESADWHGPKPVVVMNNSSVGGDKTTYYLDHCMEPNGSV